jgi:hypothetical protein
VIFHRGSHQTIKAKKSYIAAFQDRQFWHDPSFFSSIAAGLMVIAPVKMPQKTNHPTSIALHNFAAISRQKTISPRIWKKLPIFHKKPMAF